MFAPFYAGQPDYIQRLNDLFAVSTTYYGPLAADPSARPDGTARQVGDRYYNTTAGQERTWSGSAWSPTNLVASQLAAQGGGALVGNTPAGNITATIVQAAINELDAEKAKLNGDVAQNFQMASLNGGQLAGLRNKLINGNMGIDQRNNGSSVNIAAGASAYVLDRWLIINSTNQTVAIQQTATTFASSDVHRRMRVSFSVAPTTGVLYVAQRIEGADTFAGQTATASFYVATAEASLGSTIYTVQNFGAGGSSAVQQTPVGFLPNNTILRYSGTFAVPSIVGKTVGVGSYVECGVSFAVRSTNAITITDAQFEIGAVATPSEQRPIGMELALCQRYLPVIQISNSIHAYIGQAYSANVAEVSIGLPVVPRVAPTGMLASGTIAFTTANGATTGGAVFGGATTSSATLLTSGAAGLVAGNATSLIALAGIQTIQFTGCEL
jgi:hypothetical protein